MTKGLNIVSRLTFENIPDGTLPTSIPDENQYSNYSYTKSTGTITIETIDGIKFIKLNSVTAKIYSPFIITDQSNKNFQAEFDVIFDTLKVDTHLVSIGTSVLTNALRVVASNNPAQGLRLINGNNQISSYYKFENNKKYTICVGFKDKVISMYVDGTIIGYFYSEEFINSLNVTTPSTIILGAPLNNTNDTNTTLYGKLGNINISSGPSVKHEESYTKYGTNLVSFLNFENLAGIGTYKTGVEAVYNGIEWRGVESTTYSNGYGNIKNISTDLTGEFTVTFSLKKFKVANANILKYGNYSVDYVAGFIPVPDPDVIVNDYTTSALNFENGLVDQIGTTVWTKEGTSDITSVNKIFGENSFETKALGDGLYTNSNVITGRSAPFTIEGYYLFRPDFNTTSTGTDLSLFSLCNDSGYYQGYFLSRSSMNIGTYRAPQFSKPILDDSFINKRKIKVNEINKITISYDGSALRSFINDELDGIYGTSVGLEKSSQPLRLMSYNFNTSKNTTSGLIDNINIHDGIATKVRNHDPYEEFLVVDLAFDGENNSNRIVDNGNEILRKNIPYNECIVSLLHFDNNINDATGRLWSNTSFEFNNTDSVFGGYSGNRNISSSSIYTSKTNDDFKWSTQNYTIEMFVKVISSTYTPFGPGRSDMICSSNDGDSLYDWGFGINERNKLSFAYWGGAEYLVEGVNTFNDNNWHHIAMVNDGSTIKLFADGILEAQDTIKGTPSDSSVPIRIGAGNSFSNHKFLIDELCITKGIAKYKTNFNIPITQFQHVPKNKWTVNGAAKISTAQKFDGFSSLTTQSSGLIYTNSNQLDFKNENFTISFDILINDYNNTGKYNTIFATNWDYGDTTIIDNYLLLSIGSPNDTQGRDKRLYFRNTRSSILFISNNQIDENKTYSIKIIRQDNKIILYVNGKTDTIVPIDSEINFSNIPEFVLGCSTTSVYAESLNGYLKNFKIYKGVAVIPEDPTGKIQLDFDNNLVDKYGNSNWTNNGVTFDQVNSVKGYAAYFNGSNSTYLFLSQNNNLNFENYNFEISMDFKSNTTRQYDMLLASNHIAFNNDETFQFGHGINSGLYFRFGNKDIDIVSNINPLTNQYYSTNINRYKNTFSLKMNDVLIGQCNSVLPLNITNGAGTRIGGIGWGSGFNYNGYIDNFKSIKDYQEPVIIDKPAVHLPLETNAINTGFTPLTINSVGSPTYITIDDRKCIKFESGKYLTINSNNIFNLGTNSDFYIEFDFYLTSITKDNVLISNGSSFTGNTATILQTNNNVLQLFINNKWINLHTNILDRVFYNIAIHRKNNILQIKLDSEILSIDNGNVDFSVAQTNLGSTPWYGAANLNGYMSNFKMFVGTSQPPETYNDKKVLDLDFKPTGKSYLFKDNNNKCVIHPVNITQRDYQDSQYCCTFNGVDQHLQLGKNDLLNFGNDDFVIEIKFKISMYENTWYMLLGNNVKTSGGLSNVRNYCYIAISPNNDPHGASKITVSTQIVSGALYQVRSSIIVPLNQIVNLKVISVNNIITLYMDDVNVTVNVTISTLTASPKFDLNANNDTYIGYNADNWKFKGSIYSIKILRNTTDLSLLEDENTDVIVGDTTLTLSNGTDSQEVIFDNKNQNDFRFVHSNDSTKLIVNEQILEVPNVENELNELSLFTDFNAEAKDIKTYNIAFEDEDTFSGNVPIHTQFGEVEDIDTVTDIFHVVDQGDFIVNGFFEGRPEDSRYQIRNRFDYIVMHSDSGPFNYNGLNERFIDDYEIYLPDTKETMPIPTETMERGYITISITPTECEGINFGVKVFRRSDNKLIGIYNFNNYICTIDNLDCNKRYDCIIFDQDVNLESRCLSNRTPIPY